MRRFASATGTFEIDEAQDESQVTPCYLHIYVPDADACYEEAVRAGATSLEPPSVKPYGERSATVEDPFGNTWFLATYLVTQNRRIERALLISTAGASQASEHSLNY